MARGYWIAFYRSVSDPDALAAYAKLAGPAIAAAGGGDVVNQAYQAALKVFGKAAERDLRIVDGLA